MFKIKAKFINLAVEHEYVLERWQKIVNAVIEKTHGILLSSKLWVIHLIESSFSLMIVILSMEAQALFWRKGDRYATDSMAQDLLLFKNWGINREQQCSNNRRMQYEYFRSPVWVDLHQHGRME